MRRYVRGAQEARREEARMTPSQQRKAFRALLYGAIGVAIAGVLWMLGWLSENIR
jgi:hypothetical protein